MTFKHYLPTQKQQKSQASMKASTKAKLGSKNNYKPKVISLAIIYALSGVAALSANLSFAAQAENNAQVARQQVAIPAGKLSDVLAQFAATVGVPLSFEPSMLANIESKGLQGRYNANEGFAALLSGTGYQSVDKGNGGYSLQAISNAMVLPAVTVAAEGFRESTEGTGSYTTSESSFGKGQSLKELPQTVTVMTHERIQDQAMTTLDDVLTRTVGVTAQSTDTANVSYYSRGFSISNYQIDGNSSLSSGLHTAQLDIAIFDSVEVLRGSDALYGNSGEPGGAINLVRKKPTKEFQLNAQAYAGSWNNYRGELDVSGSLTDSRNIRARFVGVHEDKEHYYDIANSDKTVLYGIVEADITDSTLLTLGANFMRNDATYMRYGLPRYSNGDDIGLPRSTFLGTSDSSYLKENSNQFIRFDQKVGKKWSLSIEVSRLESLNERDDFVWFGTIDPITYSGFRSGTGGAAYEFDSTQKTLDAVLKGSFNLLGGEHHLTFGANINQNMSRSIGDFRSNPINIPNIFEFDPAQYLSDEPYNKVFSDENEVTQQAVYGSLALEFSESVTLLAGGRLSWYEYRYDYSSYDLADANIITSFSSTEYKDDAVFTPYVGLVYDLSEQWSIYGSLADTYQSQASRLEGPLPGTPLNPVTGRTYEIGIKGSLFDSQMNTSFALYSIKRNGEAESDPAYPSTPGDLGSSCCYLGDGRIVSQGVDMEIGGYVATGWEIQAGYTYNDNENKANSNRNSSVTPKHLFKLWSSYQLEGMLSGLKIGGGITAQSDTYKSGTAITFNPESGLYNGDSVDYDFTEPGRVLVDLFAKYRFNEHWSAALNIDNVLDETYYETVGVSSYGNWYGKPRNFMLSVKYNH